MNLQFSYAAYAVTYHDFILRMKALDSADKLNLAGLAKCIEEEVLEPIGEEVEVVFSGKPSVNDALELDEW